MQELNLTEMTEVSGGNGICKCSDTGHSLHGCPSKEKCVSWCQARGTRMWGFTHYNEYRY